MIIILLWKQSISLISYISLNEKSALFNFLQTFSIQYTVCNLGCYFKNKYDSDIEHASRMHEWTMGASYCTYCGRWVVEVTDLPLPLSSGGMADYFEKSARKIHRFVLEGKKKKKNKSNQSYRTFALAASWTGPHGSAHFGNSMRQTTTSTTITRTTIARRRSWGGKEEFLQTQPWRDLICVEETSNAAIRHLVHCILWNARAAAYHD